LFCEVFLTKSSSPNNTEYLEHNTERFLCFLSRSWSSPEHTRSWDTNAR